MVEIKKKLHYLDVNNYIHHSYDVILSMVFNCKELENKSPFVLSVGMRFRRNIAFPRNLHYRGKRTGSNKCKFPR